MQLVLNGKKMNCPCDHLEDLKAAYGSGQEIIIVNGFATTENLALKEGDEIYFIPKDRLPPKEALEGMMCSRHTPKVHQKVSAGRVAICGLGGLGSNAAVYLARTGVGHLHLIDFDTVDASNLNRQSYMSATWASARPTPWPGRLPTSIPSSTSARTSSASPKTTCRPS